MSGANSLSPVSLLTLFTQEMENIGGSVTDAFRDETRLFARAVLAPIRETAPNDGFQGGVALRYDRNEIRVYPYLFRQVCTNGAIQAHTTASRCITQDAIETMADWEDEISAALRECCAPEIFAHEVSMAGALRDRRAEVALNLFPLLRALPQASAVEALSSILEEFGSGEDNSLYGLFNAVTAIARRTPDPELRWDLEEYGGGIGAAVSTPPPPRPDSTAKTPRVREHELVLV
jgi:hypothetical protein